MAAECTLSDSFHCIDALLTPGAIQEFLAANEGYSVPRLLGHLVKLRACELTLDEGGASCCLVVHGFATINSDQCFPFGDPIPVLDDPAVKALLRQRREAHRCPPRPSHAPEESTQDMLIHMAEASCPELDERECVISASQEAIFEQLLGESEVPWPAASMESQAHVEDDLLSFPPSQRGPPLSEEASESQDFYASQPPLEWKLLFDDDDDDDNNAESEEDSTNHSYGSGCAHAADNDQGLDFEVKPAAGEEAGARQRHEPRKANEHSSSPGTETATCLREHRPDHLLPGHIARDPSPAVEEADEARSGGDVAVAVAATTMDMFPPMDPLEGWWAASPTPRPTPSPKTLSPPLYYRTQAFAYSDSLAAATPRSPAWPTASSTHSGPPSPFSLFPSSSQTPDLLLGAQLLHEEDLLPRSPPYSPIPLDTPRRPEGARAPDDAHGVSRPSTTPDAVHEETRHAPKKRRLTTTQATPPTPPPPAAATTTTTTTSTLAEDHRDEAAVVELRRRHREGITETTTTITITAVDSASAEPPPRPPPHTATLSAESGQRTPAPTTTATASPSHQQILRPKHRPPKQAAATSRYSPPSRDAIWELVDTYFSST